MVFCPPYVVRPMACDRARGRGANLWGTRLLSRSRLDVARAPFRGEAGNPPIPSDGPCPLRVIGGHKGILDNCNAPDLGLTVGKAIAAPDLPCHLPFLHARERNVGLDFDHLHSWSDVADP